MHWKKKNFFCHHNFMKKGHSKLYNNEPENIPKLTNLLRDSKD